MGLEVGEGARGEGPVQPNVLSVVSGGRTLTPSVLREMVSVVVIGQTGARLPGSKCSSVGCGPCDLVSLGCLSCKGCPADAGLTCCGGF